MRTQQLGLLLPLFVAQGNRLIRLCLGICWLLMYAVADVCVFVLSNHFGDRYILSSPTHQRRRPLTGAIRLHVVWYVPACG
jgi:hypothetical protein